MSRLICEAGLCQESRGSQQNIAPQRHSWGFIVVADLCMARKVKNRNKTRCSLATKCQHVIVAGNRVPAITNHFRNTTGHLNSFELRMWRSNEEQYSEEAGVFKALLSTNGPQNTLSFFHLAYLFTSPSALEGY